MVAISIRDVLWGGFSNENDGALVGQIINVNDGALIG
jgi:hypothetical protein